MKRMNQLGFSTPLVVLMVVVLTVAGFSAWQITKSSSPEPPVPTAATSTETTDDCGDDRNCFYQAYVENCMPKTFSITRYTIEGDPIPTTANLSGSADGCVIEVTVDVSQDAYGSGEVRTYTCKNLAPTDGDPLLASECVGTSDVTTVEI